MQCTAFTFVLRRSYLAVKMVGFKVHSCKRLVTGNLLMEYYRNHFNIQVCMTEDLRISRKDKIIYTSSSRGKL